MGAASLSLGAGGWGRVRGERKERVGWVGHTGREESLVRPGEHSKPFIQHEAGE